MKNVKIVCVVTGGVLAEVWTDTTEKDKIEVIVHDADNLKAEGRSSDELDKIYDRRTRKLNQVYG